MKTRVNYPLLVLAILLTGLYSCKKETTTSVTKAAIANTTATLSATTTTQAIAIGSLSATSGTATDSLYMVGCYPPKGKKDSVTFSALPTAIGTYLTANYAGYTFLKAFKTLDSLKAVDGYVVVINFNSKPVGLKFTAAGVFVKVLEQREGHDLVGPGWHPGGRFDDRDGMGHDTIALSAIPTAVKTFFTTTYPTDTLLHAAFNPRDTTYMLVSKNKGLFATVISSTGKLIKRMQIDKHPAGNHTPVLQTALPASISTYLTTTFPGYVFDKAFADKLNNVVQEYDVFISVNGVNHAVKFDATGAFVSDMVIR